MEEPAAAVNDPAAAAAAETERTAAAATAKATADAAAAKATADAAAAAKTGVKTWQEEHLPVEIRNNPTLATIKDVGALGQIAIDLKKMTGMDKLPIPGSDAEEKDWNPVYDRLGRPGAAKDYKLEKPKELPPGYGFSKEMDTSFRDMSHKLGLNQKQAAGLFDMYHQELTKGAAEQGFQDDRTRQEAESALMVKYGAAYNQKKELARNVLYTFFPKETADMMLADTLWGNVPGIIEGFVAIGEGTSEDRLVTGKPAEGALTPDEAKTKIAEIYADPKHPYNDATASKELRQAAIAKMEALSRLAHTGPAGATK